MQILITGGARSGKSRFAEEMVQSLGTHIGYIATAVVTDEDMASRIAHHQNSRPREWTTIEEYKDLVSLSHRDDFSLIDTYLLDCITVLATNFLFDSALDFDTCSLEEVAIIEAQIINELDGLMALMKTHNKHLLLVTNEVGQGIVPAYRLGSIFRDLAGRINQHLARSSDSVYWLVSGIPVKIK